ncbi:MAG TPA: hypothetical protein VJO35_18170 [Terriglobales bacterium]|nr:hypothetical protein [Terriglobales bacterium]
MYSWKQNSKGFTLITTLILLCLLSALSVGLLLMVNTEAKVGSQDVQNNYTFHAAEGGIETMTAALANTLHNSLSPTAGEIQALSTSPGPPSLPGITFPNPGLAYPVGGYTFTPTVCNGPGDPVASCTTAGTLAISPGTVLSGPYAGLNALVSNVQLQATAEGLLGDEVSMTRTVEIALIPVFQFGMFSDSDLSFFAGPDFSFGGRVHTNGDLYLSQGAGTALLFHDKLSAYGNVIRNQLANGFVLGAAGDTHTGAVYIPTQSTGCDAVALPIAGAVPASCGSFTFNPNDGSTVAGPGTGNGNQNPSWMQISTNQASATPSGFNSFVIDGDYGSSQYGTGATSLTLPFVSTTGGTTGAQQYEILRRPPNGESSSSPLGASRLYNEAQIRILLSDDPNELPCNNPSVAPPCGGSADPQNVRLANGNYNGVDYTKGVPQTSLAALADGGTPTVYFATANTGIADPEYWSGAGTTLAADWAWGPLYTFPMQSIYDPAVGSVTGSQAPYMLEDAASGKAYGMQTSPMPGYLLLCAPPAGATTVTSFPNGQVASYKTNSATTPPTCPDAGAYPYYTLNSAGQPGQTGADPTAANPLSLPFAYSTTVTASATNQSAWNLLDGYLRVEYQDANGVYHPVTQEWLGLGFARNTTPPRAGVANNVNPNAILILQEPANRDGNGAVDNAGAPPTYTGPVRSGAGTRLSPFVYTYTLVPSKPPEVTADSNSGNYIYGDSKVANSPTQYNWYPINFYDAREGEVRENGVNDATCTPNGIMNAVEIDVGNLKKWLAGTIGASGASVNWQAQNGYILYFSDRRGMLPNPNGTQVAAKGVKSGDAGLEDTINSSTANGKADGTLDGNSPGKSFSGEDVNLNGQLDNWGAQNLALGFGFNSLLPVPATGIAGGTNYKPLVNTTSIWYFVNQGGVNALGAAAPTAPPPDPYVTGHRINSCSVAQGNWVSGARHVLKLVDGALGNVPLPPSPPATGGGFTIGSENPVYVQGDYNSNAGDTTWTLNGTGGDRPFEAASAIIGDSVTLLSSNWNDWVSLLQLPTDYTQRPAVNTYYRVAISGGKNINFTYPAGCAGIANPLQCTTDFGTDGGVHNFLRYLENWGGFTLSYKGSIASLYYSTYDTGTYKSGNVYNPPTRNYYFDTNFNQLSGLPPGTPMFRDIDNLSFRQAFNACTVGANNKCSN